MFNVKKFISGLISGVVITTLLITGTQAIASGLFTGKKITGETQVKVNGNNVGTAIITENKSFIPVREIANEFNASISFEKDGSIVLTTENPIEKEIMQVKADIVSTKTRISNLESSVSEYEAKIADIESDGIHKALGQRVDRDAAKKNLEQQKEKLAELESKLKELQAKLK